MTKRILVLLDPDFPSPFVTNYAIEIARRNGATLTGLGLVDTSDIDKEISGGGIGSMYYAEKLRRNLTDEARSEAQKLLSRFVSDVEEAGIQHSDDHIGEGPSVETLANELRVHDLLISGSVTHSGEHVEPKRRAHLFAKVLREGVAAILLVGPDAKSIRKVTIAVGKRETAARTIQRFVHLSPFGTDVEADLVNVRGTSDSEKAESETLLDGYAEYFRAHGYTDVIKSSIPAGDSVAERILGHVDSTGSDLLVTGAYSRHGIRRLLLGTATTAILEGVKVPLFIAH